MSETTSKVTNDARISRRGLANLELKTPMRDATRTAYSQLHHPISNPQGATNLGTARNELMCEEMLQKIQNSLEFQLSDFSYGDSRGSERLRGLIASFLNNLLKCDVPLNDDNIITTAGTDSGLFYLTMALADPGDSILVAAPYYGNFDVDLCTSTGVDIVPIYPFTLDDLKVDADKLEAAMQEAKRNGKRVSAIAITSPHNPIGRCFSKEDLERFVRFASKHSIHFIVDEVYAGSSFGHLLKGASETSDPFVSVLSLKNLHELIDPGLVHVVYGVSKDFGLNGLRIGFIIDQYNEKLRKVLAMQTFVSYTSTISDRLVCNILEDEAWVDWFLATNKQRLAEAYQRATDLFDHRGVAYIPAQSGHYVFVDLRPTLRKNKASPPTTEDERLLWQTLLQSGVCVSPGHGYHIQEAGFMRVTFAMEWSKLEPALEKFCDIIDAF
ncbi:hypothetical protein DFQ28_003693 [Apophysomyces sp. BC1034]|nr:hypothetical protein DFQ30_003697 [Apophysomyces sp. BC1015]KAG0179037.1 hypothetical protein DFQ29_002684 [Apophysomyces sp. BC1021]KAG0189229.1 hypothetical protein DFQ28_003693 [Apophysomyces sp. BC1034]